MAAVLEGGKAEKFCLFAMQLRGGHRTHRTLENLRASYGSNNNWTASLEIELWSLYRCMKKLHSPNTMVYPDSVLDTVTREQRTALSGTGLVRPRKVNRAQLAAHMRAIILSRVRNFDIVVWMDNFNKQRYSRNPNEDRDRSINGTVTAVLQLPRLSLRPLPYPSLKELVTRIQPLSIVLVAVMDGIRGLLTEVSREHLQFKDVRVPLDIRRSGVLPVPWLPAGIDAQNVGSAKGLLAGLEAIRQRYTAEARSVMVLVDVNIFYRGVKMFYSDTYAPFDFRRYFQRQPMVLGVWHSYKYVLCQFYIAFLPLLTCLEHGMAFTEDPCGIHIPNRPKVILMEKVVLGLFLVSDGMKAFIKSELASIKKAAAEHPGNVQFASSLKHINALWSLLYEYVPVLFHLGRQVRTCHWGERTVQSGMKAKDIHSLCLLAIIQLRRNVKGRREEYVSSLVMQLLMWSPFHSHIPAHGHSEEVLEAMLSRLSKRMRADLTATSITQVEDIFVCLGATRPQSKDLNKPGISKVWPHSAKLNVQELVRLIVKDEVPFIKYTKDKGSTVTGSLEWPENFHYPKSLLDPISATEFEAIIVKLMTTLLDKTKGKSVMDDASIKTTCPDLPMTCDNKLLARKRIRDFVQAVHTQNSKPKPTNRKRRRSVRPNMDRLHMQLDARAPALHPSRERDHVPAVESHVQERHPIWRRNVDIRDEEVVVSSSSSDTGDNWGTDSDDAEELPEDNHIHVNTDDSDPAFVFLEEQEEFYDV